MNEKVEKHLQAYCVVKGFEPDRSNLKEALVGAKEVWEGDEDEHRWCIFTSRVVEVDGMLIMYNWGKCTGDNSLEDAGFEWDWDSVFEVEPHEVTVTHYRVVEEPQRAEEVTK